MPRAANEYAHPIGTKQFEGLFYKVWGVVTGELLDLVVGDGWSRRYVMIDTVVDDVPVSLIGTVRHSLHENSDKDKNSSNRSKASCAEEEFEPELLKIVKVWAIDGDKADILLDGVSDGESSW